MNSGVCLLFMLVLFLVGSCGAAYEYEVGTSHCKMSGYGGGGEDISGVGGCVLEVELALTVERGSKRKLAIKALRY